MLEPCWCESVAESDCDSQLRKKTPGGPSAVRFSFCFRRGLALLGFTKVATAAHLTYAAKSVWRSSAGIGPIFSHSSIKQVPVSSQGPNAVTGQMHLRIQVVVSSTCVFEYFYVFDIERRFHSKFKAGATHRVDTATYLQY